MEEVREVSFKWNSKKYEGYIEKEYDNSFLVMVMNPSPEITEKYMNRMIVRKKDCALK